MSDLEILVTNDDGIEAPGIRALAAGLSDIGNVTVVAPADDQSAVGRTLSYSVEYGEHELGYLVHGTPSDCVIAGLSELCPETDVVVSGCNRGANLGAVTLGRSGTVSAAVEAAFFGVPAVASSMYIPGDEFDPRSFNRTSEAYESAVNATAYLTEQAVENELFDRIDYLNVNAPTVERSTDQIKLTYPSPVSELTAKRNGKTIDIEDELWEKMADGDIPDDKGTDRRTILNNHISVSPLSTTHTLEESEQLQTIASAYLS